MSVSAAQPHVTVLLAAARGLAKAGWCGPCDGQCRTSWARDSAVSLTSCLMALLGVLPNGGSETACVLPLPICRDGLTASWLLVSVRREVRVGPKELGMLGKAPRKRWTLNLVEKAFTSRMST